MGKAEEVDSKVDWGVLKRSKGGFFDGVFCYYYCCWDCTPLLNVRSPNERSRKFVLFRVMLALLNVSFFYYWAPNCWCSGSRNFSSSTKILTLRVNGLSVSRNCAFNLDTAASIKGCPSLSKLWTNVAIYVSGVNYKCFGLPLFERIRFKGSTIFALNAK